MSLKRNISIGMDGHMGISSSRPATDCTETDRLALQKKYQDASDEITRLEESNHKLREELESVESALEASDHVSARRSAPPQHMLYVPVRSQPTSASIYKPVLWFHAENSGNARKKRASGSQKRKSKARHEATPPP